MVSRSDVSSVIDHEDTVIVFDASKKRQQIRQHVYFGRSFSKKKRSLYLTHIQQDCNLPVSNLIPQWLAVPTNYLNSGRS